MIARSDSPAEDARNPPPRGENPAPTGEVLGAARQRPSGLVAALVVAAAGALLVGAAPAVGMVAPAQPPAFTSWPLLLVLAALPPGLAAAFLRSGKHGVAAAVLIAPAALAPGRAILDAQPLADASGSARPELLVPTTLDPAAPALGCWLLLAGHVAVAASGVVAHFAGTDRAKAGRAVGPPVFGDSEQVDDAGQAASAASPNAGASGTQRRGLPAFVLCVAVVAAVAVLMRQFTSDNPYLVPRAVMDAPPPLVLIGSIAVAVAALITSGVATSTSDLDVARGTLLGLASGIAGFSVPPLVAASVVPEVHYGTGAVLGLASLLVLAVLSVPAGRPPARAGTDDLRLPALGRLHNVAGALAVLAGILAVFGAVLPELQLPEGVSDTSAYPAARLWPAGLVMIVLGAVLLQPRANSWIRPALPTAWAVLPLTVAATLDSVFSTLALTDASAGVGAWASGAALAAGGAAAAVSAVAGSVERDDVDRTEITWRRAVIAPCALAAVLAVAAFSFPAVTAPGYQPPGLFTDFSTTSWGIVVALVAVVAACAIAPAARPPRSAALLSGAAAVALLRVLELPLSAGRVDGLGPGPGFWSGLGCFAVLVVAAVVGGRVSAGSR